jgi:hypothetical protein
MEIKQVSKNCSVCTVDLTKRTWILRKNSDNTFGYVEKKCKYCIRNAKWCRVEYSDPELRELSIRQRKLLEKRSYYKRVIGSRRAAIRILKKEPTVCRRCGSELSEKNECIGLSKDKKRIDRCKHCRYGIEQFCKLSYSTIELEEFSILQNDKITAHLAIIARRNLDDNYIKILILNSIQGLSPEDITPNLIEIKKKQLIVKRKLKNQKL